MENSVYKTENAIKKTENTFNSTEKVSMYRAQLDYTVLPKVD